MENQQFFILVVEDDQLIQNLVEDCLSEGGFETVATPSGEKAIELLDAAEGKYRALVTDINLKPGEIDGWEVARHAREIDPHFPVVYMSGIEADDWASKGVPNSIVDFNSQVPDRALDFGVPQKQLHGSQVARTPIDEGRLCSTERMRSEQAGIQPYAGQPTR